MKRVLCLGLACVLGAGLASPPARAQSSKKKAVIQVVNDSDWPIYHLYLTPHDSDDWGDDQLGEVQIDPHGGRFTIRDVACDDYDVELADESGDTCEVDDLTVCGDETWTITNRHLAACPGWGR